MTNKSLGSCNALITSRTPNQCHEGGPCPHLNDPSYPCPCLPEARRLEAGIVDMIQSGQAEKQVKEAIKHVGKVV